MGLDMYLKGKIYASEFVNNNGKIYEQMKRLVEKLTKFKLENGLIVIEFQIGYWRKANHIHKWFVDNIQNGVDDCGIYYVERKQLEELKELCLNVLENKQQAHELLPRQKGFFFGSQEYDKHYFEDIKRTIKIIDSALKLPDDFVWIYYESSW